MSPTSSGDRPVAGLVLAAGRGERFGAGTKQLALLDGRPLVAHVIDAARGAGLSPIVVVVGHDADLVRRAVGAGGAEHAARGDLHVVDVDPGLPQSASLRAGLAALDREVDVAGVAVLLADEPRIDVEVVDAVLTAWRAGAGAVVRTGYRDRPGHPFVAARTAWPEMAAVDGDAGARRATVTIVTVAVDADAPVDVDTLDDLDALGGDAGP